MFGRPGNTCWFVTYGILLFICGSLIVISGSFGITIISNYMLNIRNYPSVSLGLAPGVGNAQQNLGDFMLGLYEGCCGAPTIPMCPEVEPEGSRQFCYLNSYYFTQGFDAGNSSKDNYCSFQPLLDACVSSTPINDFLNVNYLWFKDNVQPLTVAVTAFGCVILLGSIFSWVAACSIAPDVAAKTVEKKDKDMEKGENDGKPVVEMEPTEETVKDVEETTEEAGKDDGGEKDAAEGTEQAASDDKGEADKQEEETTTDDDETGDK